MNPNTNSALTIHFMDGTTESYEFETHEVDPLTFAGKLDKALARNQIMIQCADRTRIIPVQSVKHFEFTMKPPHLAKLPEFIFDHALLVSTT